MKYTTAALASLLLLAGCSGDEKKADTGKYQLNAKLSHFAAYDEGYPLTDEEIDPDSAYKTKDFQDYYNTFHDAKLTAPAFDFNMDLSSKSFRELRQLRAEILARHNFLFMDYTLRAHFNKNKWYQPVFWYPNFQIRLNEQEKTFINKVLALESKLYEQRYITSSGFKRANLDYVVNWDQFENMPASMTEHLQEDGFVINKGEHEQLFHVYDQNFYDYTPSFITTDLFLQVLHMHISKEMQAIEEDKMIPLLTQLLSDQYERSKKLAAGSPKQEVKQAASFNQVYYAMALSLLSGEQQEVPAELKEVFATEYGRCLEAQGRTSVLLGDSLFDYTQFQPRGNYTRNDSLKRYFRCIKWLNSAPLYIDKDLAYPEAETRLASAVLMGKTLLQSEAALKNYRSFSNVIQFLAGEENNLSLFHLLQVMEPYKTTSPEELLSEATLQKIHAALSERDPKKMQALGANERTQEFLKRKKLLFTAGRYTFDAEILQRLVHITAPEPKRPFPKGLDVFAGMGNKTAEDILLNHYKENENWKGYGDTLNTLKSKFRNFRQWDLSIYNKKLETLLSLQKPVNKAPYYMHLPNWEKRNLNTMLASWTELKHDMVLYIEQPSGAEMGGGGGVPPPQKLAYVEPQLEFWKKCMEILELNKKMLADNGLWSEKIAFRNNELASLDSLFINISKKELDGEKISVEEFDQLSMIGGRVERLTLEIIESELGYMNQVSTPDRYMAVIADVYTYNSRCLEEGVGMGDEIYVIAEINGLLYLTKGAVFSQYEFVQPTTERLTDEAWQKNLLENKTPKQAAWMDDIKIQVKAPGTAPHYSFE